MPLSKKIFDLGLRFRYALTVVAALLVLGLLYPFQTTIVPNWHLLVLDDAGSPVQEINVTEHWRHYLLEAEGHEEIKRPESDGRVTFPERTIRASLLRRVATTFLKAANSNGRARVDASASVVVWGSKRHETSVAVYRPPDPPDGEISVHRLP